LALAVQNLLSQKTRTVLTALGIIFGVGAVIGMLAIGAGARRRKSSGWSAIASTSTRTSRALKT